MTQSFKMFTVQEPEINQIRHTVRYGKEANNPNLLNIWFAMEQVSHQQDTDSKRQMYHAQCQLLIETLYDETVIEHWRSWCLDNINKPLLGLQRLVTTKKQQVQLNNLYVALRSASNQ
ncbi:hypothetical protein [Psychromonas sp. Urea-02u-13]|uniref:hypothetical protein n=1 Tax=Psychromonas sp. Urea-02u-13 TaxID=2058326 RepID=UPI000C3362D2|nr:hypothetical protein [Psychromonas sp. Urea-02u-13]PKG37782.1 hypothetical protein CXF74_17195 [Psychromonas sp. Urea-02u-13]